MKKSILFVVLSATIFCTSCTGDSQSSPAVSSTSQPSSRQNSSTIGSVRQFTDSDRKNGISIPDYYAGPAIAFDFSEFPKEVYPSGEWSVNELEDKYGNSKKIQGSLELIDAIYISVELKNISVVLYSPQNGMLSFDKNDNKKPEFYELSEQDKVIKFPIDHIWINGENSVLPRGLKLNESTLEQVKAAYSVNAGFEVNQHEHSIIYQYVHFDKVASKSEISKYDIGSIEYYFAEDDILALAQLNVR